MAAALTPRVLLLGGHGKIALHLTPLLLARSWDVVSVVRNPNHEAEIAKFNNAADSKRGTVSVLVSSLEDVKSVKDANDVIEKAKPDYVVWAAGAGGSGPPERTFTIDRDAAKHFIHASLSKPSITKFLLISYLGSRRKRAPWWSDADWESAQATNRALADYHKAKVDADEYLTGLAIKRREKGDNVFQGIILRPGTLSDEPATGKIQIGHTPAGGKISREDVAIVADRMLARPDTRGWKDLLAGNVDIDKAINDVTEPNHVCAIEGEDVDAMKEKVKDVEI